MFNKQRRRFSTCLNKLFNTFTLFTEQTDRRMTFR